MKDIPDIDVDISELSNLLNLGSPNKITLLKSDDNYIDLVVERKGARMKLASITQELLRYSMSKELLAKHIKYTLLQSSAIMKSNHVER